MYPKTFLEDRRDIYIEGETYLEVEKDQSRPFFVHTKDFDVSVLGTKFNVSAYKEDLQKSVVLVEGSVEVGSDNNKYKLIPKEGFFYAKNSSVVKKVVPTLIPVGKMVLCKFRMNRWSYLYPFREILWSENYI